MTRYRLRLTAPWQIDIREHPGGAFANREAAFNCALALHEARPASFDARAAETATDLLQRIHNRARTDPTR